MRIRRNPNELSIHFVIQHINEAIKRIKAIGDIDENQKLNALTAWSNLIHILINLNNLHNFVIPEDITPYQIFTLMGPQLAPQCPLLTVPNLFLVLVADLYGIDWKKILIKHHKMFSIDEDDLSLNNVMNEDLALSDMLLDALRKKDILWNDVKL